jgi:hypothetical protein
MDVPDDAPGTYSVCETGYESVSAHENGPMVDLQTTSATGGSVSSRSTVRRCVSINTHEQAGAGDAADPGGDPPYVATRPLEGESFQAGVGRHERRGTRGAGSVVRPGTDGGPRDASRPARLDRRHR